MPNQIVFAVHPVLGRRAFPPKAWELMTDCQNMNGWELEAVAPPAIVQQTIERNHEQASAPDVQETHAPAKRGRKIKEV